MDLAAASECPIGQLRFQSVMRMENSHAMARHGFEYRKSPVQDTRIAHTYNFFNGPFDEACQEEGSVIRRLYTVQTHGQRANLCVQSSSYSPPSVECLAAEIESVQSRATDLESEVDRRVITPDSTDMVSDAAQNKTTSTSAGTQSSDPKEGPGTKPPMSYIGLISKAILQSPDRRMNLGSIYTWMEMNFPYFRQNSRGWRNSVRHNLSLNDCFIKAGRCEDGKGNYWTIHPENLDDFIRGDFRLRRRSRRRGRKGDNARSDVLVKPTYQPPHSAPGQLYVPASMTGAVSFPAGQQYLLQDPSPTYPQAYNTPYTMYDSNPAPHGPPIPPYGTWTHTQGGDQCMDLVVPSGGHNYSHNPPHLYGYTNYSYPAYSYQPGQW